MESVLESTRRVHAEHFSDVGRSQVWLRQAEHLRMHLSGQAAAAPPAPAWAFEAPLQPPRHAAVPPVGAELSPGLCAPIGDSRPGLGASPLWHTSVTFTGVQGRVVHLQEKTNKHGGRGSASVQTLLIWLSVSMEPQPQRYCWHVLRRVFDKRLCVGHTAVCVQSERL